MNKENTPRSRRIYPQLVMIAAVVLSLMAYSYISSNRILNIYAPLVQAVEGIRLETTTAHLWVDEILIGYSGHNMDEVSWLLDEADWYAQAILEGGKDSMTKYIPVSDPFLRQQIKELRDKLSTIREITEERYELDDSSERQEEIEQYYDKSFNSLLDQAEEVRNQANEFINREIKLYRSAKGILAIISIFLFALAGILFHRHQFHLKEHSRLLENEISERIRAERELTKSEDMLSKVFNTTPDSVVISRLADGKLMYVNSTFTRLMKYTEEEALSKTIPELNFWVNHDDKKTLGKRLEKEGKVDDFETELRNKDNKILPVSLSASFIELEGDKCVVSMAHDITERKQDEEMIKHMAHHDLLTGLPNRTLFMDRLEQAIARSRREKSMLAVMFLDLDKFKPINDTMGHTTGDLILRQIAEKLTSCMRETDTVARFGGDEFIALITDLSDTEAPTQMAKKLDSIIAEPIRLGTNDYSLGVSIGIALYPEHGNTSERLISLADEAMYMAKADSNNVFLYATPQN